MPDRLIIQDLTAECRLGLYEWEQEKPQPIGIDLELAVDAARAARRDSVGDAIDYARLVTSVKELAQRRSFRLLETLAESIASLILQKFDTNQVRVRVKKRALPGVDYAAVEVERTRRGVLRPRTAARRSPARHGFSERRAVERARRV